MVQFMKSYYNNTLDEIDNIFNVQFNIKTPNKTILDIPYKNNISETHFKELLLEYIESDESKIKQHEYIHLDSTKRQLDFLLFLYKMGIEVGGPAFHHIFSKTVNRNINYHKLKKEIARQNNILLVQYSTENSSKRYASKCYVQNIDMNIITNEFLNISIRTEYFEDILYKKRIWFKIFEKDYKPIFTDNIKLSDLKNYDKNVLNLKYQLDENFVDGPILDDSVTICYLIFQNENYQFPKHTNYVMSAIQYIIYPDNTAHIFKHFDMRNAIYPRKENNTLLLFAHFLKNKYNLKHVYYHGNCDNENIKHMKFYHNPEFNEFQSSNELNNFAKQYLETYEKYPLFKLIDDNVSPQYIIKDKHIDNNNKRIDEYDSIKEYGILNFKCKPYTDDEITKKINSISDNELCIFNSGYFILELL